MAAAAKSSEAVSRTALEGGEAVVEAPADAFLAPPDPTMGGDQSLPLPLAAPPPSGLFFTSFLAIRLGDFFDEGRRVPERKAF